MKLRFSFVKIKGPVGLTEPSGVTFISDDRYLAVQDEIKKSAPFYRLTLVKDRLVAKKLKTAIPTIVDDLEGIFYDDPFVYAITSHSSSNRNRRRLIRFRLPESDDACPILEEASGSAHLKALVRSQIDKKDWQEREGKFNIEGFALHNDGPEMFIGLRSPLINGKALVVMTRGIRSAFSPDNHSFTVSKPIKLDLKGGGIRAMAFIRDLGGYLLVSGRGDKTELRKFRCKKSGGKDHFFLLWFWDGKSKLRKLACFPKYKSEKKKRKIQPEGISPALTPDRKNTILFVSDDGGEIKKNGRYWLLTRKDYRTLKDKIG